MMNERSDDKELLRKFGEPGFREAAFTALVQKYQERLYWQIRRMVHTHEDADDLLQDVFIKVWQKLHTFRHHSKLYTWLYRIATNEALAHLAKERKRHIGSIDDESLAVANRLKADPYFNGDDAAIRLQQAINQLPDKQKAVFTLRYYQELKYDELSQILETSEGALKASYHHAVKKIEKYLKQG